jgi:hypothetical protein
MADYLYKTLVGRLGAPGTSTTEDTDVEQLTKRHYVVTIRSEQIGADAEECLIDVPQADIVIDAFYCVSGLALAADANNPIVFLAKGNLAAGALTAITSGLDLADALATRTQLAATIVSAAAAAVTAGQGLYLDVNTQGTPGVITETTNITFVVEWHYAN